MDSSGLGGAPAALDESNAFMGLGAPPSDGRQLDEDLMFLLNTDMINESLPSVSLPTGVPGAGSSVPVPELADSGDLSSPLGTGAVLGTAPVLPTAVPKPDSVRVFVGPAAWWCARLLTWVLHSALDTGITEV